MKTAIVLLIFFFSFSYCSAPIVDEQATTEDTVTVNEKLLVEKDSIAIDEESGLPEPQFVTDSSAMQILSANDTLYKGDTLNIHFKVPHVRDLAITTPDDNFFFIVYAASEQELPPLVDWNEFASMATLQIITSKTKANPWDARIKENQFIFTKTGQYEIRLSENLETDDGTPVEVRTVYYINKPRKEK